MNSYFGFMAAALVVLLIPGVGVTYVVTRSISQGCRAGLLSVLGLSTGALVYVFAATLGLSAILLASATAFGLVKILGAGYLIYLGVRTLLTRDDALTGNEVGSASRKHLYTGGVLVSLLNPKLALFFLAFLPQFVVTGGAPIPRQVLVLGLIYTAMALVTDSAYAILAASIGSRFSGGLSRGTMLRYVSGSVFIVLGVCTALISRQH